MTFRKVKQQEQTLEKEAIPKYYCYAFKSILQFLCLKWNETLHVIFLYFVFVSSLYTCRFLLSYKFCYVDFAVEKLSVGGSSGISILKNKRSASEEYKINILNDLVYLQNSNILSNLFISFQGLARKWKFTEDFRQKWKQIQTHNSLFCTKCMHVFPFCFKRQQQRNSTQSSLSFLKSY